MYNPAPFFFGQAFWFVDRTCRYLLCMYIVILAWQVHVPAAADASWFALHVQVQHVIVWSHSFLQEYLWRTRNLPHTPRLSIVHRRSCCSLTLSQTAIIERGCCQNYNRVCWWYAQAPLLTGCWFCVCMCLRHISWLLLLTGGVFAMTKPSVPCHSHNSRDRCPPISTNNNYRHLRCHHSVPMTSRRATAWAAAHRAAMALRRHCHAPAASLTTTRSPSTQRRIVTWYRSSACSRRCCSGWSESCRRWVGGSEWAGCEWAGRDWAGSEWAGSEWAGSEWAGRVPSFYRLIWRHDKKHSQCMKTASA